METLDRLLILLYRLPDNPVAGFYLGTAALALGCVLLGAVSTGLVYLLNRSHYQAQEREMVRMHNISVRAIRAKDKESYKASNLLANEYFGKSFFARAALFAVSIWPLPFALGWLDARFGDLAIHGLPVIGFQLGHAAIFLILYLILRLGFSKIKPRLPLLDRIQRALARNDAPMEEPLSWFGPDKGA
ncbi:MAG: hypothetical protein JW718_06110 [Desulfovibrionaceae bacterium]|nr:hypothetical protein [Desulfovibrionaceae bacterium]